MLTHAARAAARAPFQAPLVAARAACVSTWLGEVKRSRAAVQCPVRRRQRGETRLIKYSTLISFAGLSTVIDYLAIVCSFHIFLREHQQRICCARKTMACACAEKPISNLFRTRFDQQNMRRPRERREL